MKKIKFDFSVAHFHLSHKAIFLSLFVLGNMVSTSQAQTEDSRPDLNGNWANGSGIGFVRDVKIGNSICMAACDEAPAAPAGPIPAPDRPSYKAEVMGKVKDLTDRQVEEDPILRCLSPGIPRIGPPDKIVQQENQIVFLYDDVNGNYFRVIPTDGRGYRTDVEASALGDAIGYWDGDTLVVETENFDDNTWLTDDGSFHTTDLKVTERIKRDGDNLHWDVTVHDPSILNEPWQLRPRVATLTDLEIVQAPPCIDRDLDIMQNMTHHPNPR